MFVQKVKGKREKKNSKTRHTCWFRIQLVRRLVHQLNRKAVRQLCSSTYVCFYKNENDRFAWNYYPEPAMLNRLLIIRLIAAPPRVEGTKKARSILTRRLREGGFSSLDEFSLAISFETSLRFEFPLKSTDCCR